MYCQMSSSVQLDSGNTRTCSPGRCRGEEQAPQLRTLTPRIPLPELVAQRLNTRSLARAFSSSRRPPPKTASNSCRPRWPPAAGSSAAGCACPRPLSLGQRPVVDEVLDLGHVQPQPVHLGPGAVPVLQHLREVVTGVHVQQPERDPGRPERPLGQGEHHDRVLAAGEQQHRPLELGGDLPHDVDGLGLEHFQLGQRVVRTRHGHQANSGSSGIGTWSAHAPMRERR